jgi:tetratricopeptide (TPR) repeat protein
VNRLARSYLAITREADQLLRPYASGDPGTSTAPGTVLALADASQARTWLTTERRNLLRCVQAMSPTTEAADLSTLLAVHFRDFGFWSNARSLYNQALTVYRHLGNQRGEVDALRGLGRVERLVGEYSQAREHHTQALTLAQHLGDRPGEAEALWGLGHVATDTAERDQACELWRKALEIYEELGVPFAETVREVVCQLDC